MNKKTMIAGASVLGIISVFMPWFTMFGESLNLVNELLNDGYMMIVLFVAIIILSVLGMGNPYGKKKGIIIEILAVLQLLVTLYTYVANSDALNFGAKLGIGYFLCLIVSAFIVVFNFLDMKASPRK